MTDPDVQATFACTLVDEWVRGGVEVAAVAPGSRSTPLALALAGDPRMRVEVFLDERSAAFFALGVARASGRPAVVLCTSGTAAANFHPAVLEAWHGRVPMVVCTADRPPELRDTGAGQATDQIKLFGASVRWFCEVGVADGADHHRHPAVPAYWRSVAARSVADATGPPSGPVHLNLAFREPLVPTRPPAPSGGRTEGRPWITTRGGAPLPDPDDVDRLAASVAATPRGLVVAGWGAGADGGVVERFAAAAGWPVLADPLSGARQGPHAISTYDALLRVPAVADRLRPDLVVHLGAPLTGKVATAWLDADLPRILVDPDRAWLDPHRGASERVVANPGALLAALADRLPSPSPSSWWLDEWLRVEATARAAIDRLLDVDDEPSEARVARDLVGCLPDGASLVVGSSMPVRDVEAFARPRSGLRFHSNRGVNGIDGFVSTVLGVAAGTGTDAGPVVALCGDLTFLHDTGGLLEAARRGIDAVLVVVDNCGGGIFSFLPQAALPEHFEVLWGTPHHIDLAALCAVHRLPVRRVTRASELAPAVSAAVAEGGIRVVIVTTVRDANVAHHRRIHDTVSTQVSSAGHSEADLP